MDLRKIIKTKKKMNPRVITRSNMPVFILENDIDDKSE